ncbi:MAG: hypothetical protein ACSHYB_17005 [Roseibacillus sp.]
MKSFILLRFSTRLWGFIAIDWTVAGGSILRQGYEGQGKGRLSDSV